MKTLNKPDLLRIFDKMNYQLTHHQKTTTLDHIFLSINKLLTSKKEQYVDLLHDYPKLNDLKEIDHIIGEVDHIGLILPNTFDINVLEDISSLYGFNHDSKIFPSTVLSKLLGEVLDSHEVPTMIFKNYNTQNQAIEIFIPKLEDTIVHKLIQDKIGNHIGFRIKDLDSLKILQEIMKANQIPMPEFMHGEPIVNPHEKSKVFYYKLDGTYKALIEFIYIEPS